MISRRGSLSLLASVGALLIAVYTLNLLILAGAVAVFAAVAGELLQFHVRTPGPAEFPFEATRTEAPRVLSPGTAGTVELIVKYPGPRPVQAEVRELLPSPLTLVAGRSSETRHWNRGDRVRLRYGIRGGARGSHLLGPVAVTIESPHGLAWAQWTLPASDQPVRVVPHAPIERAHRIGPALLTTMQGRVTLRRRGFGTEFRSLRPYQLSDDIRHVAWKRSRPGQWFVREFEQESRQDYLLLIDLSPPMRAGRWGEAAIDRSVDAATVVVHAIARQAEDRVGLMTYVNGVFQYIPPGRGPRQYKRLTDNLALMAVRDGTFDFAKALDSVTRRLTQHSHVFAFSALGGLLPGARPSLARFRSRGHRLYQFVPEVEGFYPPPGEAVGARVFRWASNEERKRREAAIGVLQEQGIPVFPFDRSGAAEKVMAAYYRIRSWETAR